jgi:hypothetical protein
MFTWPAKPSDVEVGHDLKAQLPYEVLLISNQGRRDILLLKL